MLKNNILLVVLKQIKIKNVMVDQDQSVKER